jgi:exodeoxyribonuclease V
MKFGKQQREAINAVRKWLEDPNAQQVFRLFGYAGSGKTTIAKYIEEMAKEIFKTETPTCYAAYTGKAALVLRQKGCTDAQTIHSLIYKPIIDDATGNVIGFKKHHQSPLLNVEYATLDEISMVNDEQGPDLEGFNKKLLVLGDPFQLDPVTGEGYFTQSKPDYMMTKIHRQAKDNPIIYMATQVRKGRGLAYGRYGESRVIRRRNIEDDFYTDNDQILCGINKTRTAMNTYSRKLKGREGVLPVVGDKLICLKNDKDLGVLNGSMWTVNRLRKSDDKKFVLDMTSLDMKNSDDQYIRMTHADVLTAQFMGDRTIEQRKLKGYVQLDFGELITTHKGQGSQWDKVGIINESYVFGEMSERHLYTGLTRAAQRVTLAGL